MIELLREGKLLASEAKSIPVVQISIGEAEACDAKLDSGRAPVSRRLSTAAHARLRLGLKHQSVAPLS